MLPGDSSRARQLLAELAAELDRLDIQNGKCCKEVNENSSMGGQSNATSNNQVSLVDKSACSAIMGKPESDLELQHNAHNLSWSMNHSSDVSCSTKPSSDVSYSTQHSNNALEDHSEQMQPGTASRLWVRRTAYSDADALKKHISFQLAKKSHSHISKDINLAEKAEIGLLRNITDSVWFENISIFVIFLNSIWIAIETDYSDDIKSEAPLVYRLVDTSFCVFFSVEWVLRFMSLRRKCTAFCNAWFLLDSFVVGMMVLETSVLILNHLLFGASATAMIEKVAVLRLIRLVRLTRMTRVIQMFPELLFMMKGLVGAFRGVSAAMSLLLGIIYIFSIILKQLSDGTNMGDQFFSTVPNAMYTLIFAGTLLDGPWAVMDTIVAEDHASAVVFGCAIVLLALTMMNMLTAVLVEGMSTIAASEQEHMDLEHIKTKMHSLLGQFKGDGIVTKDELHCLLQQKEAMEALNDVGVDVVALVEFADFIFQSDATGQHFDKKLDFEAFMDIILKLRGHNPATVRDIVDIRKFVNQQNTERNIRLLEMEDLFKQMLQLGRTIRANQHEMHQFSLNLAEAIQHDAQAGLGQYL